MEKLLSIIMPVYNAEKTIEKAIDSILYSSKDFFELILVNDGSPDNSAEICKKYLSDSRVVYFEKENGGLSSARNFGVEHSKGMYVTFPDPDDYYVDGAVDRIEKIITDYVNYDVIGFGFYDELLENGCSVKTNTNSVSLVVDFDKDSFEKNYSYIFKTSKLMTQTAWSKLYRRDIIIKNNLLFEINTNHAEDIIFFFDYLYYTTKIVFLPDILYCYCSYAGGNHSSALEKRKGPTLVPSVSLSLKSFVRLNQKYSFNASFLNMMYESFFQEFIYSSKKIFMPYNKISQDERYKYFGEFLEDKEFIYLRDHYFGSYRFYKILYALYGHGFKRVAYYLYKKKIV